MKKNLPLLLILFAFISNFAIAQNEVNQRYCHTYEMFDKAAKENPQMIEEAKRFEEEMRIAMESGVNRVAGTQYVIPVVFHIMHDYGSSNISNAQVYDALSILNEDFQKLNSDTSIIASAFSNIIGDADVEFRLAQLDPNGNCTDGITRTYTPLTWAANDNVKQLISWPRGKYLNVWVVASLTNAGAGAYAYLPSNSTNPTIDGIITRNTQFGSIGMSGSSNLARRTLTHETGHFFGLHHTWGAGNTPGVATNCGLDDFINDTPLTIGSSGCNTSQVTCSTLDNVQNYMDYSSCERMFTEGQVTRMHNAMNSFTAQRNNLSSAANLIATGTNDGYSAAPCIPVADFAPSIIRTCTGTPIGLKDASWGSNLITWNWDLSGATPSTSTSQNPVVTYNSPGIYNVSLTASNASGSTTKVRNGIIIVSNASAWYSIPASEGFENGIFPDWQWRNFNEIPGSSKWQLTTNASSSGTYSVMIPNYVGNSGFDDFITPSYNLGNVSGTQLTFKLAYAARSTSGTDQLKIYASDNCGETWNTRYTKSGANLSTAGLVTSNFVPNASQWRQETVNLASGSVSGKPNVIFKFEYTMDNGNNIYIDDININGVVSVDENLSDLINLNVMPNPAQQKSKVTFSLNQSRNVKINLIDVTGRNIMNVENSNLSAGDYSYEIDNPGASGIYFLNVEVDNYTSAKKLVFTTN